MDFLANSLRGVRKMPVEEEDEEVLKARAEKELLDQLYNNFNIFYDTLELNESVQSVDYVDLVRALCHNTTVRYVVMAASFLESFSVAEIRILLEIIGGMPKLETLTVHMVPGLAVTGQTIADVLRRTKILKELHFHDLELAGDDYDMEPLAEALETLTSLKSISFHQLVLQEVDDEDRESMTPDQIVIPLSSLPALEEVVITSKDGMAWDEESLGGLCESKTLKSLKVNNIELDGSQLAAVAGSLLESTSCLEYLQLSDCSIDEEGWKSVVTFLPDNQSLQVLDLSQSTSLDDDICFLIGSAMEGNTSLKELKLQDDESSEVTSQGITTLSRMLEKNNTLECLEVSFTATDNIGFKAVGDALLKTNSLKQLYIENHAKSVSTKGVVFIGRALEKNRSLEKIGIVFDGEDSEGVLALAQAMQKSPSLKHFAFNRADYCTGEKDHRKEQRPSIMALAGQG